ncbi:uncharacterized protein LOC144704178 [Wolffia australiana]
MASQGKFVSVNLNKSYGRPSSSPGYAGPPSNSFGNGPRPRSGGGSGTGGGNSGGMAVLSRPRSSLSSGQKNGPKLAVPPPLNLPSLRKEHERFDVSAASGRAAGSGSSGLGHGHGSQAMGWTRTSVQGPNRFQEDSAQIGKFSGQRLLIPPKSASSENRVSTASAAVLQERNLSGPALRGEDFPSLLATFEASKKQRDVTNQKVKPKVENEEPVVMRPTSRPSVAGSTPKDYSQKKDDSLSDLLSLPAVNLKHKSDWADDERDTGTGFQERDRRADVFSGNSRDFLRTDSYGRDPAAESLSDRGGATRQNLSVGREMSKESSNYAKSPVQRNGYQESWQNRRAVTSPLSGRYTDSYANRSRVNVSQNLHSPKAPFSPGPNSRDRRIISDGIKPGVDDTLFDIKGSSLGGLSVDINMKIFKRKKDTLKPSDFYDPVRESFEVELQRVQQLQEMERQRVLEEQSRAIEMARKEEEERERLAREEEEKRKKLEEEAREAAEREEQARLEASKKAEEQRIAREEEKKRILMEEERRKEAAREKLLELEARIARRQAETAAKVVERSPSVSGDRQLTHDLSQKNSDFAAVSRNIDAVSRTQSFKEGNNLFFAEKGRPSYSWRKDSSSNTSMPSPQNFENNSKNPKQDAFGPGRGFPREEYFGSSTSARASSPLKGVRPENEKFLDDFRYSGSENEFLQSDGELGWRQSRSSDEQLHSTYSSLQDAEMDGVSSFGRSRYSLRQPRVPPPPFSLTQRRPFRATNDAEHQNGKIEGPSMQARFENGYQNKMPEAVIVPQLEKLEISLQNEEKTSPRCASQSSLSMTSPPSSPTQLSHEDLDESKELLVFSDIGHPPSAIESGEDDEWDIENGEVQDQEEYEEENGYREEDEAHDGDDENIVSAEEHADQIPIALEDKLCDSNEGEIPESSQKDLGNQETVAENAVNDMNPEPLISSPSINSVSSLPCQPNEVPLKLQFGLFSGPSLIPPPVPAIQIGSIQMPLPLPQVHSSQSPFYQFGQLGYSSLPQGLLPMVHPTLPPAHYSLTHNKITVDQKSPAIIGQADSQENLTTSSVFDASEGKKPDVSTKDQCPEEKKNECEQVGLNVRQARINRRDSTNQKSDQVTSLLGTDEKPSRGTRFMNSNGGRGKRYVYKVKSSSSSKPLLPEPEDLSQLNSFQRRFSNNGRRGGDFRPKELVNLGEKQSFNGRTRITVPFKNGLKRDAFVNKPNMPALVSESKTVKSPSKELIPKRNKRYESIEEDIDPPVQSGIIRIFKQPGIEVPSDEDDFIEVRSKRQMLNDRREQREKQNKAKSRVLKVPRRPRSPIPSYSNKNGLSGRSMERGPGVISAVITSRSSFDLSTPNVTVTQPLAPIGTPSINGDSDDRSSRIATIASGGTKLTSGLGFEKDVAADGIPLALGPWNETLIERKINILTTSDSGVNDGHAASIAIEPEKLSEASNKPHEKTYSSSATSLSSVFPGERIQFGAVTSAKILHPLSRAVSRMSTSEESSSIFIEKEKLRKESSIILDDPEAEAEAAASAVAVAAISNDEIVGNELGDNNSISNAQDFQGSQRVGSRQSAAEEPLTVALPADLSVETPTLSLWPPLRSTQSNSGPMISCFPGGPPSHYPCYEMNPIMGGPIFAFGGPNDESPRGQAQQMQRAGPTHLGPWPACHSGVDSFYGPPAGFTGPFISPPLGIPGVQAQPHMLVYNHFTPVGQFGQLGQLGLGFMGATYIPSGKQPDWKHSPGSANGSINGNVNVSVSGGPGDGGTTGASTQQRGASPLLPMASPLTMFDMSPFQPPGDIQVQARWSHLAAAAPLPHSVPLAVPPPTHYQIDQSTPQFNPVASTASAGFLHEPQPSGPVNKAMKFPTKPSPQFPDERDLVEAAQTAANSTSVNHSGAYSSPARSGVLKGPGGGGGGATVRSSAGDLSTVVNGPSSSLGAGQMANVSSTIKVQGFKPPPPAVAVAAAHQPYTQANGGEWYRRQGLQQGKNQSSMSDKSYSSVKVKQIYVAKPATSGASSST